MTAMEHAHAEAHDLADAYLAGRLSEEERAVFEAHYFDCAACLERLEATEGLREGMRQVAAEDLAGAAADRARLGLLAALAALSRGRRLALAAAFLLLAALPGLWLLGQKRALEGQLAAAVAGAGEQRAAFEARLRGLEEARAADRRRQEEALGRERERQARTAVEEPQVNVPVFLLAAVRSGEEAGREPVNQVPLAPGARSIVLTAELATVDFPFYRASLRTGEGREIWKAEGLRPDDRDTLVLLLPASLVPPGVYRLAIEGGRDGGRWFAAGVYPFRVVRRGS